MSAPTTDRVTILSTLHRSLVATKRIRLRPGQPPDIIEFDRPKYFQAFEREVDGLASLAALLAKVERHPRAMVMRGQLRSGANPQRVRRLRYARNGEDGDPCFDDMPRCWLLLDFDALEHPPEVDPSKDPEECVRIAARLLPPAFHGVSCWWQFTSGAGIKPGIRMRLGYWLDRPLGERDLKRWLPRGPLDQSILSPVQPIYVAWPIFEEGADPVPVRSGTFRGSREAVPVPSVLEPAGDGAGDRRGLGYAGYCGLIGDHPGGEGFHDPTKAAIAAWVGKHGADHPTAWLRRDIERAIRAADRRTHSGGYIEEKVQELDALIAWTVERERSRPPKQDQATATAAIAGEAELFHAAGDEAFADIEVKGHRETHRVRSKAFKQWLSLKHYSKHGKPPSSDAVEQTLVLTEARARYEAPERVVHLRVARLKDRIYLDLADTDWRAVEVDARGWRVVERPPVRFRRAAGMLPLPVPLAGGNVNALKPFLNVDDDGFTLAVAWQLAALGGMGPYPILAIYGDHGAAKTSTGRYLRRVLDPNELMSRSLPRSDHDLYISAHNAHVVHFENISKVPEWMSDTLCRLATGGGFGTRELWQDSDEVVFRGMHPLVMDGIEKFVERDDLADRAIKLRLKPMEDEKRRAENEMLRAFEREHPSILGALLTAVSHGLRELDKTRLEKLPRMADFALWIAACEGALWEPGEFQRIYESNRESMQVDTAEGDGVADEVMAFMRERKGLGKWRGRAGELLRALEVNADLKTTGDRAWPKNARALSAKLRRLRKALFSGGIKVEFDENTNTREIILSEADGGAEAPVLPIDVSELGLDERERRRVR